MSTTIGRLSLVAGALGSLLALGTPAFAQHGGGGGGHGGGGGGGHFGGGAHSGPGPGGGHAPAAHGFSGGVGHAGYSGGYGGHPGGGYGGGYGGHPGGGYGGGYGGRPAGYGGGYYHGYSTGAYWHGGYWHGGYWPRAYYGVGFAWFLPVLPLAYATYWYGSIPYYYANDVYYTWNPSYDGYVATDPPPVGDSGAAGAAPADQTQGDPQAAGTPPQGQLFMYPKNGQSEEQQSTDKRECQQWASSQANPQNPDDYRRAMLACVEGRGYSAQ